MLIGIEYIIECSDFTYLMYFAISENKRNNGYGSKVLQDLKSKYNSLFLCIEKEDENKNNEKVKRKKFYLRNGFYQTNQFFEDNGILYELLSSNKDYNLSEEKLKERYTKMTNSIVMTRLIKILFNVDNITFIENDNNLIQ